MTQKRTHSFVRCLLLSGRFGGQTFATGKGVESSF
jgi:hypothetical protein